MGKLAISHDSCADFTVLSNRFIDEYMADANDAQLKIYLYLLRMVSSGKGVSVSDLADFFNYTEKDILRALRYWERKNLLSLSFDEDKNLNGLTILSMPSATPAAPMLHVFTTVSEPKSILGSTEPELVSKKEDPYEKPNYSLDELKAFKACENTSRILFITEQYLKKTLTPNEMKTIFFISDKLGFSEDLVDYLIQYCVGHDKKDLRYIEKVAINWAQSGITTPKQAAKYVYKYDKSVYEIMNALGKNTSPTTTETAFINRWTKEYGFEQDVILEACERTVLATDKHRFEYADKILSSWFGRGVHHRSDIEKLDVGYKRRTQTAAPSNKNNNQFNCFEQNQYDFDALEKKLLSN